MRRSRRLRGGLRESVREEVAETRTIGVILRNNAKYDRARPLLERALAIRERALGPAHVDVARSLVNLSNLDLATGR